MSESLVELMAGLVRRGWRWDFWSAALVNDELHLLVRPDQLWPLDIRDDASLQAALSQYEAQARSRGSSSPPD